MRRMPVLDNLDLGQSVKSIIAKLEDGFLGLLSCADCAPDLGCDWCRYPWLLEMLSWGFFYLFICFFFLLVLFYQHCGHWFKLLFCTVKGFFVEHTERSQQCWHIPTFQSIWSQRYTHWNTRMCVLSPLCDVCLMLAEEKLTLAAELIHFVMNHFFDAASVRHPWVVIEGLECFARAVGLWIGFAILAVGRGAGVTALRVLPGGERAVRPAFLHFHSGLLTVFSIKRRSRSLVRSSDPVREKSGCKIRVLAGWFPYSSAASLKELGHFEGRRHFFFPCTNIPKHTPSTHRGTKSIQMYAWKVERMRRSAHAGTALRAARIRFNEIWHSKSRTYKLYDQSPTDFFTGAAKNLQGLPCLRRWQVPPFVNCFVSESQIIGIWKLRSQTNLGRQRTSRGD